MRAPRTSSSCAQSCDRASPDVKRFLACVQRPPATVDRGRRVMSNVVSKMLAAVIFCVLVGGCASAPPTATPTAPSSSAPRPAPAAGSLYDRLGKKEAITVVVDDFVANLLRDPIVKERFAVTDVPAFKALLVDQICEATGGPCKYKG